MVKLVGITENAENIISYCARVSNPANQDNYDTAPKLLAYLIKHKHWSPFEMANMVLEIETGRDVAPQILRHRSFSFQEFSQRYAEAMEFVPREARRQDLKNRQNSTDDLPEHIKEWFKTSQEWIWKSAKLLYDEAIQSGVAKECARALLPLNTSTRIYMNGSVRSWITYFLSRLDKSTQKEHRDIARECYLIFKEQLPNVSKTLEELYPEIFCENN